jgi:hypothetical protein
VIECECAVPVLDVDVDAACRRCGRPVNYAPPVPHHGELRESDYGFAVWTVCSCGWRSRTYRASDAAVAAHEHHKRARSEPGR